MSLRSVFDMVCILTALFFSVISAILLIHHVPVSEVNSAFVTFLAAVAIWIRGAATQDVRTSRLSLPFLAMSALSLFGMPSWGWISLSNFAFVCVIFGYHSDRHNRVKTETE